MTYFLTDKNMVQSFELLNSHQSLHR